MTAMRSKILLMHAISPTPLDTCWSIDARVYAAFAERPTDPIFVGNLENTSLRGFRHVQVHVPHPYEVAVTVHAPVLTEGRRVRKRRRLAVTTTRLF